MTAFYCHVLQVAIWLKPEAACHQNNIPTMKIYYHHTCHLWHVLSSVKQTNETNISKSILPNHISLVVRYNKWTKGDRRLLPNRSSSLYHFPHLSRHCTSIMQSFRNTHLISRGNIWVPVDKQTHFPTIGFCIAIHISRYGHVHTWYAIPFFIQLGYYTLQ